MSVAAYVRCSTVGQNEESQVKEIQKWLEGQGIEKYTWYIDKVSGDTLERPQLAKLQKDIFNGRIKTVIVWKLDRLSRSQRDGINVLCDWCDKGIRVVSVTQQIDFNGAAGKLIASVLFAVAEMELETKRERQYVGISAAKERGVYTGRKKGAVKPGVDPRRARELKLKGLQVVEIANAMDVSVSSVKRYLRDYR
jgi:DNA invertase Pin-like site-specific DNA recombinase